MICVHRCCRTAYKQSEKVGVSFGYQAVVCMGISFPCRIFSVSQQTMENSPNRHGVVRCMAWSDH